MYIVHIHVLQETYVWEFSTVRGRTHRCSGNCIPPPPLFFDVLRFPSVSFLPSLSLSLSLFATRLVFLQPPHAQAFSSNYFSNIAKQSLPARATSTANRDIPSRCTNVSMALTQKDARLTAPSAELCLFKLSHLPPFMYIYRYINLYIMSLCVGTICASLFAHIHRMNDATGSAT